MPSTAINRPSDVQLVADLLHVFVQQANKGLPALAMNNHLPSILEVEQSEYIRLLLLAAADGLITTIVQGEMDRGGKNRVHYPHLLTDAGELYLEAWRGKGGKDRRWPDAWVALQKSGKPLTPANMLGNLRVCR